MIESILFEGFSRSRHQLSMLFRIDDLRFTTSYWYGDVDFIRLEEIYGSDFLEKVYFHIMAFEANKLGSLCPARIDLGPFARFHTKPFESLWRQVFRKVWAQWRYENNRPDYQGPVFCSQATDSSCPAVEAARGSVGVLSFCGGGKDSLVMMRLLERARIPFSSLAYSHSIYGRPALQHTLIGQLLNHTSAVRRHQQWIFDDFVDSPVLELHPELDVRTLAAAETPSSLFAAIPLVLAHGYRCLVVGHERSADTGNLIWTETGEEVNHQWGKSLEAEIMLEGYLRRELVSNARYCGLLKPIYDVTIFNLLRHDLAAVPATHSCNVQKPWCGRCPKCAYVWLNYMAYLPSDLVTSIIPENLFDLAENQLAFRQMLGFGDHTPFECIGEVPEARLAFEMCRRKGIRGAALNEFEAIAGEVDVAAICEKYLQVNGELGTIPPQIAERVVPQMYEAATGARRYIDKLCDWRN